MSRRRTKMSHGKLNYPQSLILVEKWSKLMGKRTKRLKAELSDGTIIPIVTINHGNISVLVRSEYEIIVVFINAEVPYDIKNQLEKLDREKQEIILESLKQQLLSNGRTGYYLEPISTSVISELSGFTIEQRIRISSKDPSSFNRLMDAIQEVITVTIRALLLFGILPSEPPTDMVLKLKPPEGMYA